MKRSIRKIVAGVLIIPIGITGGAIIAMATSDNAPESEDRKISEMPQDERNEAMDMRTLPNGKTIGHGPVGNYDWRPEDLPDFIMVKYGDLGGKVGYVRKTDAFAEYFQPPTEDLDELIERQDKKLRDGPRTIPVFADDGETVVGEKQVGRGGAMGVQPDGTTITYDNVKGTETTEKPDGTTIVKNLREGTKTTVEPDGTTTVEDLRE